MGRYHYGRTLHGRRVWPPVEIVNQPRFEPANNLDPGTDNCSVYFYFFCLSLFYGGEDMVVRLTTMVHVFRTALCPEVGLVPRSFDSHQLYWQSTHPGSS
jgi:hypothetical protein